MELNITRIEGGYRIEGKLLLTEAGNPEEVKGLEFSSVFHDMFLGSEKERLLQSQSLASVAVGNMMREMRIDLVTSIARSIHDTIGAMHEAEREAASGGSGGGGTGSSS